MFKIFDDINNLEKSNEKDKLTDNFDEYLSKNNMFGILFYSNIIPDKFDILSPIRKYIVSKNLLRIIICICEDNEEDYKKALAGIDDFQGLYLDYKSEDRNKFINKFNIISLPKLVIIGKKGKIIDCLNTERILNLNDNDIKSWNNKCIIFASRKDQKPEIGDVGNISKHKHELVYSENKMKIGYGMSGYICDVCRKNFKYYIPNFYCSICGYDVCDECYKKYSID